MGCVGPASGSRGSSTSATARRRTRSPRRPLGAEVIDPADIPTAKALLEEPGELEALLYEFKADINAYLTERGDPQARSLEDLIRFNEEHAAEEMPYSGQEVFSMAQEKGPLTDQVYRDALARNQRLSR